MAIGALLDLGRPDHLGKLRVEMAPQRRRSVHAFPWLMGVIFAHSTAVLANGAFHRAGPLHFLREADVRPSYSRRASTLRPSDVAS
jgi:hypothetical protein